MISDDALAQVAAILTASRNYKDPKDAFWYTLRELKAEQPKQEKRILDKAEEERWANSPECAALQERIRAEILPLLRDDPTVKKAYYKNMESKFDLAVRFGLLRSFEYESFIGKRSFMCRPGTIGQKALARIFEVSGE